MGGSLGSSHRGEGEVGGWVGGGVKLHYWKTSNTQYCVRDAFVSSFSSTWPTCVNFAKLTGEISPTLLRVAAA